MAHTNGANNHNQEEQYNFDDGNYSPANLGKGEVAWSFKKFRLDELLNKPRNVGPTPNVIYLTTYSGNIYAVYETGVFVAKNPRIYNLDPSAQNEYFDSDLIVLNSKTRKISPIDLSISDQLIQVGSPFEFTSLGVKSNTSNIMEIVGDSWSVTGSVSGQVNSIKKRLINNINR